jgi:hypothetical protein
MITVSEFELFTSLTFESEPKSSQIEKQGFAKAALIEVLVPVWDVDHSRH